MTTIIEENVKTIRKSMEIHCGFTAEEDSHYVTLAYSGFKVTPHYYRNILNGITMRNLCDFQSEGFLLDGSCYAQEALTTSSYMYGLMTDIGGTATINIDRQSTSINHKAYTFEFASGEGIITHDGIDYTINKIVSISVNTSSYPITFTIHSTNPQARIIISRIYPGVSFEFDNDTLVSLHAQLRGDLSVDNPTLPISELTFEAVLDFSPEILTNIPDNSPVWFYAGYPGDYSRLRNFYLSEPITVEEGVVSVTTEDSVSKFDDVTFKPTLHSDKEAGGDNPCWLIYEFDQAIHKCCPQAERVYIAPNWEEFLEVFFELQDNVTGETGWIMEECTMRELVATMMNLVDIDLAEFYNTHRVLPKFVDAGLPKVTYIYDDTPKWTINESEVASHHPIFEKKISKVKLEESDTYGARGFVDGEIKGYDFIAVENGDIVTIDPPYDDYVFVPNLMTFDGFEIITQSPYEIVLKATRTSIEVPDQIQTRWYDIDGVRQESSYRNMASIKLFCQKIRKDSYGVIYDSDGDSSGITFNWTTNAIGYCSVGSEREFTPFPSAKRIIERSSHLGTFTWRGNPKMQPRDIFTFNKMDGTRKTCTIESMSLDFEGGGLTSEITYREGVV